MSTLNRSLSSSREVLVHRDILYRDTATELSPYEAERCRLDLYLPPTGVEFATVVWFHGGALTFGDKANGTMGDFARSMAGDGIALVSANYRLSPRAKYPAYADDAAAAFDWVCRHIGEYGGDASRIFVAGHSAGAYLAALIGMDERYIRTFGHSLSDIAGLFPVSPQAWTHVTVRAERGIKDSENTPLIDDASPCYHGCADAPPIIVPVGDRDIRCRPEENQYFVSHLQRLGHPDATYAPIADRTHLTIVDSMVDPQDPTRVLLSNFVATTRAKTLTSLFDRAKRLPDRRAIIAKEGVFTYGDLLQQSSAVAGGLLAGQADLAEARVAYLVSPGMGYVATQWGVWRAGGVAVPLCLQHPAPELDYIIGDSGASILVVDPEFESRVKPLAEKRGLPLLLTTDLLTAKPAADLPKLALSRRAMLVYTSGTTSKPKGVVTTHEMLTAQITSLVTAWEWTENDHILHVLPLHHVHGILNVLCCALWAGATCEILPKFDAEGLWDRLASTADAGPTLFMAVPTIYARLVAAWEAAPEAQRKQWSNGSRRLRLMVSGSAALPVATLERWRQISGHTLLERFGMTEIGMALSNPLRGERMPGVVGRPLPGVEVRLVDDANQIVPDNTPGQIQVRGKTVFKEYWERPEATEQAFVQDGWFKTGDVAVRNAGVYRILGRDSVDIIKSGGYKISALEIEEVLRTHDAIGEVAVVGVEDIEWGQRVAAAVVLKAGAALDLDTLRAWCKERLAVYKVPSRLSVVTALPLNAMGKVVKPDVARLFATEAATA